MSNVAETVMAPDPGGSVMEAAAVDELSVPASVAVVVVAGPTPAVGITRIVTCVGTGMLAPSMFTVTAPVTALGNVMSGVARLPVVLAGALMPLTDAMRKAGVAVGIGREGN